MLGIEEMRISYQPGQQLLELGTRASLECSSVEDPQLHARIGITSPSGFSIDSPSIGFRSVAGSG